MWELALLLVAVTYMVVNIAVLFVQLKIMSKWSGVFDKSLKICEFMMDKSEEVINELFEDED